jgi:hypothetical protein
MQKEQEIQEILKKKVIDLFSDNWDRFYHMLLTQYGISSSEADEELDNILNKLNQLN